MGVSIKDVIVLRISYLTVFVYDAAGNSLGTFFPKEMPMDAVSKILMEYVESQPNACDVKRRDILSAALYLKQAI